MINLNFFDEFEHLWALSLFFQDFQMESELIFIILSLSLSLSKKVCSFWKSDAQNKEEEGLVILKEQHTK